MEKNLEQMRKEVDNIDTKISELLQERLNIITEVGRYKIINNIPILAATVEQHKLQRINSDLPEAYKRYIVKIFGFIFDVSKEYQEDLKHKK